MGLHHYQGLDHPGSAGPTTDLDTHNDRDSRDDQNTDRADALDATTRVHFTSPRPTIST